MMMIIQLMNLIHKCQEVVLEQRLEKLVQLSLPEITVSKLEQKKDLSGLVIDTVVCLALKMMINPKILRMMPRTKLMTRLVIFQVNQK